MTELDKNEIKNIVAFLMIVFGESDVMGELIKTSPNYLLEKWKRYIGSDHDNYIWGLHPCLRTQLDLYIKRWSLE